VRSECRAPTKLAQLRDEWANQGQMIVRWSGTHILRLLRSLAQFDRLVRDHVNLLFSIQLKEKSSHVSFAGSSRRVRSEFRAPATLAQLRDERANQGQMIVRWSGTHILRLLRSLAQFDRLVRDHVNLLELLKINFLAIRGSKLT
jgi:DNA polymerase III delta subunit